MLELDLVIHTRLSSILETLATAAVAEITSLIKEYSVLLRQELSQERQEKQITKNNTIENGHQTTPEWRYRAEHDRLSNNTAPIGASPRRTTPASGEARGTNEQATATRGGSWTSAPATGREVADKASLADMKTEPQPAIKQEEPEDDLDPELELRMKAPEHFSISPVAQQPYPTDQHVLAEEWQFQSLAAEGADELSESTEQDPDYGALSLGNSSTETPGFGLYLSYSSEHQQDTATIVTLDDPASSQSRYDGGATAVSGNHGHQRGSGGHRTSCHGSKEGRFVCKDCGKRFPYPSVLQRHVLIHTGERPHLCRVCGRSFVRKSHLHRHEKLHAKRRPVFPCKSHLTAPQRNTLLQAHVKAQAQR